MALLKSNRANPLYPVLTADCATETVVTEAIYTMTGTEATNDVVEMVGLPPGYVPVDIIVDTEDLGGTVTVDCGLLSGSWLAAGARTCGAEFMNDKAFGAPGIHRLDVAGGGRIAPTDTTRSVGFSLVSVVTPLAGAKVRLTLLARPQIEGA